MTERPTVVVEVRGPGRSGVTSLAQLVTLWLRNYMASGRVVGPLLVDRSGADCLQALFTTGAHVEVREAEPDDRDRELGSLRQERDRLRQDVERLKSRLTERMTAQERSGADLGAERAAHALTRARVAKLERRQIPESWTTVDHGVKTEWSGLSGGGVVDVRGSKADIDVVQSWQHAAGRLAWFEEEYKRAQVSEAELRAETSRLEAESSLLAANQCDGPKVGDDGGNFHCKVVEDLQAKYDRLLTAFHDTTRRPLGVTPDSGQEFYDARMADEAEARRSRYGRGPK